MNKKVLSAILFSALFAGTGTFTSCIDNDEPAGIEELRGAKAELLRAKVAVEQAQASLLMAQAEVQKAMAEKELAAAEINKAIAAINQAKADSINVKTEQEREALKQTIARNEMQLDSLQLKHQVIMTNLNKCLAETNYAYEMALAQIAVVKELFPLGVDDKFTLASLHTKVETWKTAVAKADSIVQIKQVSYDSALIHYEYLGQISTDSLKAKADTAEIKLNRAKASLAEYENWLTEDVVTKDWRAEIDKLVAQSDSLAKLMANVNLSSSLAQNSPEYIALKKAVVDALLPATVDSAYSYTYKLFNPDTPAVEDSTYVLYGVVSTADTTTYLDKNVVANQGDSLKAQVEDAMAKIAVYTSGKLTGGRLYLDKEHLASFTAEKKDRLDTLATKKVDTAANSETSTKLVNAWKAALAAYKAGKALSTDAMFKAAVAPATENTGKYQEFLDAIDEAAGDAVKISKAQGKFADAVVAYYATLPTAQVGVASITLEYTSGKYSSKSISAWLSDADYKETYLGLINDYFGGDTDNQDYDGLKKLWTSNTIAKEEYDKDADENIINVRTKLNGAFTKWVEVRHDDEKTVDNVTAYNAGTISTLKMTTGSTPAPATLYGQLVKASLDAFGKASQYVFGDYATNVNPDGYLLVQPSEKDVEYLFFKNNESYAGLGAYGKYLCATNTAIQEYAKNYKSIVTSLEGAIKYWEAKYAILKAKKEAWDKTLADAKKAQSDYEIANINSSSKKYGELNTEKLRVDAIKLALQKAVNTYLPGTLKQDYTEAPDGSYTGSFSELSAYGTQMFIENLEEIIGVQQQYVRDYERELATAKLALELNKTKEYSAVAIAEKELNDAIASLEACQAKLDEALANAKKALEIIAALNAAE